LTRAQLERFTGNYEATTYRFRRDGSRNGQGDDYRIELRDDVLYTLSNGTRKKLLPVTRTHFRRPWETIATAAFICLDGRLYLQGDMGNWSRRRPCAAQDTASAAARSQLTPVPPRPQ
jgi:type II secretory pathway component PulJ